MRRRPRPIARAALLAIGLWAAACGGAGPRPPPGSGSLYDRLGGMAALRGLVDELAGRLAADPALAARFGDVDFRRYKRRVLVDLCALCGGPCRARPAAGIDDPVASARWLELLGDAAAARALPPAARAELTARAAPRAAELARAR
jgi:truncated hemoglobin YjbI